MALTLDKAFKPRHNSIGFLRWALAFAVIFSHAGPLAGFYGGHSLGTQWSTEQSFGGVAVAGFFFLSGFLITKSRMGRSTTLRFFWRRVLRIFPAFWAAILVTAFVLAPLAWRRVHGTFAGFWDATDNSPVSYLTQNWLLRIKQLGIAGEGGDVPLSKCCTIDWNGSAWTLIYEFKGYIIIGVLGLFGVLGYRTLASLAFLFMLVMNTLMFLSVNASTSTIDPLMRDFFNIMLLTPFLFGMMFALWGDKIPIDDRLAIGAAGIAFFTYFIAAGWNVYGQFAFLYVIMWLAVRLPLTNWERFGDLSYGLYIYAWPVQFFLSFWGIERLGWFGYHLVIAFVVHIFAFLSWHLLEKRALSLKNWTPRWMIWLLAKLSPLTLRLKRMLVNPDYSSTRFANLQQHNIRALRRQKQAEQMVTEIADRVDPNEPLVGGVHPATDVRPAAGGGADAVEARVEPPANDRGESDDAPDRLAEQIRTPGGSI